MIDKKKIQLNTFLKILTIILFSFIFNIYFFSAVKAATNYTNNPNLCPNYYDPQGAGCVAGEVICGLPVACIDPSLITPRSTDSSGSVSLYSSSYSGGYLVNCLADQDSGSPFCDNDGSYWCNRDASCFSDNRVTICEADHWATTPGSGEGTNFSCGSCRSGYHNCDTLDDDCEIQDNTPCTTTEDLPGVYAGCNGTEGLCVPNIIEFKTGVETIYYTTSSPLLWGVQSGTGEFIRFSNPSSTNVFVVHNDGVLEIVSTAVTHPGDSDNKLYNIGGTLYWDGNALATSTSYTESDPIWTAASSSYIRFDSASTTDWNTAYLWGDHSSVGYLTSYTETDPIWTAVSNNYYTKTDLNSVMVTTSDSADLNDILMYTASGAAWMPTSTLGILGGGATAAAGSVGEIQFNDDGTNFGATSTFVWDNVNSRLGIGITSPTFALDIDGDGSFIARGNGNPLSILMTGSSAGTVLSDSGEGIRTFSYAGKAAFRTGAIVDLSLMGLPGDIDQWDDDNIGLGSFAANMNNEASGTGSSVFGLFNTASGMVSFIGGGLMNEVSATSSVIIGGGSNNILSEADNSFIGGGFNNTVSDWGSFIGGGSNNTVSDYESAIIGGYNNTVSGEYSFIGGGYENIAAGNSSFIGGGTGNTASGYRSAVVGGYNNTVSDLGSFIGGGSNNTVSDYESAIIGGYNNTVSDWGSFIGGSANSFISSSRSTIIGGWNNIVSGNYSGLVAGVGNTVSGEYSFIGGGYYNIVSGTNSIAFGRNMTVSGDNSFGINLYGDTTTRELSQANTMAIMGGSVGIGTTTPNHELTVEGNINISGAYYIDNVNKSTLWDWVYTLVSASSTDWSTAFSWGDHSTVGYLTSYTETDPIWTASSTNYYTKIEVDGLVSSTDSSITQITTTTILYDGNLGGYVAGNNFCDTHLSGSHMCTAEEILFLIRKVGPTPLFDNLSYAWISNGPPGYLAPSNDCNGWQSSLDSNYGPFWEFTNITGGRGVLSPCDQYKPLACCK